MSQGLQWAVSLLILVLHLIMTITQTRGTREQLSQQTPKCFSEGALGKGQQVTGQRKAAKGTGPHLPSHLLQQPPVEEKADHNLE